MKTFVFVALLATVLGFSTTTHADLVLSNMGFLNGESPTTLNISFTATVDHPETIRLWFQIKKDFTQSGLNFSAPVGGGYWDISGSRNITINWIVDPADPRFSSIGLPATIGNIAYNVDPYFFYNYPEGGYFGITPVYDNWGQALTGQLSDIHPSAVPVPATIWLLGSGLIGLAGLRRKFKK